MIRSLVYMWIGLVVVGLLLVSRPKPEDNELKQESERKSLLTLSEECLNNVNQTTSNQASNGSLLVGDPDLYGGKLQLKSHWYCFYSIRYWQYFALMVLGNYGSTLLSYSYKPFGESS